MITSLLKISQPIALLGGVLLYALGVGIANYLGVLINWEAYFLGQICVTMLQLSSFYLNATYDLPVENKPRFTRDSSGNTSELTRTKMLLVSFTMLTIGAVFTVLLFSNHLMNSPAFIILASAFLLSFFYAVPPFRLIYSGYGELVSSFLMSNLIPGLGFLLQTGEFHRLLPMLTFPITAFYLAMEMAFSLEHYAADLQNNIRTMMVRIGWQRGMFFHNLIILFGFLLIVVPALLGLPGSLVLPSLLSLPVGLFQIWHIVQIGAGAKPRWRLLRLTAMTTVGLTAYLLAYGLWTH